MKSPCPQHRHPHRLIQQPLSDLTEKLRRGELKITAPRQAILEVLRRHASPLTIKEIHGALGKSDCDIATIYRNMHTLEGLGLVHRHDFGDGAARFELSSDGDGDHHHHHLVCNQCSRVVELDDCILGDFEQLLAKRHGFSSISHRMEFFGICPGCRPG